MNYDFDIITRDQIPSNIYLCNKNHENEWNKINYFEFNNGFKCIVGANNYLSGQDAIQSIKDEMKYVLENNNPEELQHYFYENFESFISYTDCVKIYNYYSDNEDLINEVYYTYFDKEDSETEDSDIEDDDTEDDETTDETTDTDNIFDDKMDTIKQNIINYSKKYTQKYLDKAINEAYKIISKKVLKKIEKELA